MLTLPTYRLAILCAILVVLSGCAPDDWPARGISRTEMRSIPLDRSEVVQANLRIGAGELRIRGGSAQLVDARFSYRRLRMRPEFRYDSGQLTIEEPAGANDGKYRWDLAFNDNKPLDLNIEFGAGQGRLNLGSLSLRHVDIHMGVGNLRVDLRGDPKNDYSLSIHGGVGDLTVYLPENAGVAADVQGGIGSIDARGLEKRDGRYVNAAYRHSKTNIQMDIQGGIGSVHLVGE